MRRSSKFRRIQCNIQNKLFLFENGSGMTFLPTSLSKETLQADISNLVMRLVRRYDHDERETNGVGGEDKTPRRTRIFLSC